jgi:arylsulfatase A-like enzyme
VKSANVFWISIDSLRRDSLHVYSAGENRITYLDELAQQGCIFDNAFPGGNWTMPSHATMLTGLDATSHMVWSWKHRLVPETQTAFDFFHRAGYTVGCFAISQLRELFSEAHVEHSGNTESASLLKCLESTDPFFVFWHTYNVHYPYGIIVPRDYDDEEADYDHRSRVLNYLRHLIVTGRTAIIRDSYRREIQRAARFVQGVATKLKKLGKLDRTYFVITADHGEVWEPNTTFHCNFTEAVVQVPLAISGPGVSASRISTPVSQVDLLPTVLELCEIPVENAIETFDGESLIPILEGSLGKDAPVVVAGPHGARSRHHYLAVRRADWVLIRGIGNCWESLHRIRGGNLSANSLQTLLNDQERSTLDEFRAIAERHIERFSAKKGRIVELSEVTEKKLRALGYV